MSRQKQTSKAADNPTVALGGKPIGPLLLQYSVPAIIASAITSIYSIIAGIFIGYGVGPHGLTGLAVAFPLFMLQGGVCMLVAVGGATLCSIELGKGNAETACRILGHVLVLEIVASIMCSVGFLIFLDPILRLLGAGEEALPYAREYMQVMLYGSPVLALMLSLSSILRASGYPTQAMITSMVSVGVSIVLSPIFIFGFDWGMRGAAFASVASQLASTLWLVRHFMRKDVMVRFKRGIYRLQMSIVKPIIIVGLAPFQMNVCASAVVILINIQLNIYGGELAIGAFGIINRLGMLFTMIVMGLTQGMQPIIGYNFGAQQMDRVIRTMWYGVVAGTVVTVFGFIAFELFPEALARMFTDHEDLVQLTVIGIQLTALAFFLVGSQIVISSFFQSIGLPGISIFLSVTRQFLFLVPALLIFPHWYGLNGVWISMPVADALAFMLTVAILWRKMRQRRRKKDSLALESAKLLGDLAPAGATEKPVSQAQGHSPDKSETPR